MYTNTGVTLIIGALIVGFGLLAFNRADDDRTVGGGYGSGLTPSGRRLLAGLVMFFGFVLMFAAAGGY